MEVFLNILLMWLLGGFIAVIIHSKALIEQKYLTALGKVLISIAMVALGWVALWYTLTRLGKK